MKAPQVRTMVSLAAGCLLMFGACLAQAQQNKDPKSDFNPAQSTSPGAHPVGSTDNGASQATNSDDNSRRSGTTVRDRTDDTRRSANRSERSDRESNLDRQLAACLLTKNKGEVELGKFASERAKDRDVKEFAEQMVKDHSRVVDKLEQIVGSQQPNDRRSQIAREIDEECQASLKKELSEKSDKEFDACYIGSQIAGHMEMASTLKVLANHTSGQLKEVIEDAQPAVDKHLAKAKKLMDQLDKSGDHSQASKDRNDRTR